MEVSAKTRFNIGDEIYYLKDNKIHQDFICRIIIYTEIFKNKGIINLESITKTDILYRTRGSVSEFRYFEDKDKHSDSTIPFYTSREELVKSL